MPQGIIDRAEKELLARQARGEALLKELVEKSLRKPRLNDEKLSLNGKITMLEARSDSLKTARAALKRLDNRQCELVSLENQIKRAIDEINEKIRLLSDHSGEAFCPVCNTELGGEKLDTVVKNYQVQLIEKESELDKMGS